MRLKTVSSLLMGQMTRKHDMNMEVLPLAHLLLGSVQRLLKSFGEEFGSSLQVLTHLVLSHGHFSRCSASLFLLWAKSASSKKETELNSEIWRWSKTPRHIRTHAQNTHARASTHTHTRRGRRPR